jgi:hypothetical protein
MTGLESLIASRALRGTFHTLLTETDQLHFAARLGENSMGFLRMAWGCLRFVVAGEPFAPILDAHWRDAHALSTRFGYLRPADAARFFAIPFCFGVKDLDFLTGFFLSQKAFLLATTLPL